MNTMRQALIVGMLMALSLPAQAQLNPSRQITIVVPIGAGGGVDAVGRLIAEKLQERLKQPVIVENRPAAGAWSEPIPSPRPRPMVTRCC